jgi:CheY-like chemotaxis protein
LSNDFYRVVLVDDDPDDIYIFQEAIKEFCPLVKLYIAKNGAHLFELLKEVGLPNIVVLDLHMPKMSGLETLKKIRNYASYDNIPVMIYSTAGSKKEMEECIKSGADYYAVKSHNKRDIANLANGICKGIWNKRFSIEG